MDPKAAPSKWKRLSWRMVYLVGASSGVGGGRQGVGRDVLALRWVQLEASVVQTFSDGRRPGGRPPHLATHRLREPDILRWPRGGRGRRAGAPEGLPVGLAC